MIGVILESAWLDLVLYGLFILSVIIAAVAQLRVSLVFRRYQKRPTDAGLTAAQAARMILDANGLDYVHIEQVRGHLSDHYDPRSQVLRLSDSVCNSTSAAAVGVAAHEAGHAVQHARKYAPLMFRTFLVPITNAASYASWFLILLGCIFSGLGMFGELFLLLGVGCFSLTTFFQLVTLPCEFNASSRAMSALAASGYYTRSDLRISRKVLRAAAMTYVAALLTSVIQLLRLVLIFKRNRR